MTEKKAETKEIALKMQPISPTITIDDQWVRRRDNLLREGVELGAIASDKTYQAASRMLNQTTKLSKELEEHRKVFARPYLNATKEIKHFADDQRAGLELLKTTLKRGISAYVTKKHQEEVEARKQAELEQREKIEEQKAQHDKAVDVGLLDKEEEFVPVVEPVVEQPKAVPKTSTTTIKRTIKWELVDEFKVPEAFKTFDPRKVNQYVAGNKEALKKRILENADKPEEIRKLNETTIIEGIRFFVETEVVGRG